MISSGFALSELLKPFIVTAVREMIHYIFSIWEKTKKRFISNFNRIVISSYG